MAQPEITEEQKKEFEEKLKNMSPEELAEFQKQQCIFCQIISGKTTSQKIYEDDRCLAILDINPAAKGHILILPKEHYAIMPQVPAEDIKHFYVVAKYLSQIVLKTLKVGGTSIYVANGIAASQKAQHFMIHIIPRKEGDELLTVNESLLDKDLRQKVKSAVQPKLNELMGVKKEVVEVQEKLDEPKKKNKSVKKKEVEEDESDDDEVEKEEPEEEVDDETDNEESDDDDKEEPEEDEVDDDDEEEKDEGDANLDDIANLFK
jgi:histidine triad (HIT) family protein